MSAARPDTWMPLYIGDYLGDTTHLTTEQHGAYFLLLMTCWKRGGNLPTSDAQLAQIARLTIAKWRAMRETILAFFLMAEQAITHKRINEELSTAAAFIEKQTQNGLKGGRPRKPKETQTETQTKPNGFPEITTSPSPSPSSESKDSGSDEAAAFAFVGKLVRLSASDMEKWRKAYHAIPDIEAELTTLDAYYDQELRGKDRKNWFIRCSSALGKRHQERVAETRKPKGGLYGGAMA